MATDIVGSLFGVNPQAYQQTRDRLAYSQDLQAVQLDPLQQANLALRQGGRGLGQLAGGLLGMQDPELAKASQIKQIASQFNLQTPEGLRQFSAALQPFAPEEAIRAAQVADEREKTGLGLQKTKADITRAELSAAQEEQLRAELAALPPNASEAQVIEVVRKYGSPDKILQILSQKQERDAARAAKSAAAGGDGAGVAGPVGKSGAYRDADGIVYSASEMAKQRAGFQGLEKLADNLNSITKADVKNAESFFDYTQGETLKTIGGKLDKKTIAAQSKINASQLLKQIESLPPGSASNADMVAAKSSFPGYGNAGNLETWVKNTKQLLADSMQRQSEQYGFKQKVKIKGLDEAGANTNQAALDWLKANPNDPRAPAVRQKLGIQ